MNAVLNFEMGKALRDMAVVFRHKWDSDAEIGGYLKALADLTTEEVTAACDDLARTERFMPRPAKIRQRVDAIRRKANGGGMRPWAVPETMHDPDTGKVVRAYRCRECFDTGWIIVQNIIRDGLAADEAARYSGARRCGCGRLREPSARAFKGEGEQWQGER